jgi:hypothetical protein
VASVPVILVAEIDDKPDNVPDPTVIEFKLVTPARVVTLGCDAVCNVPVNVVAPDAPIDVTPARVVMLGCDTVANVPVIEVADTDDKPDKVPEPTVIEFKLVTPAKVVILGCDAVCKVPVIEVADTDDKPDKVPDPTVIEFKLVTPANVVTLG